MCPVGPEWISKPRFSKSEYTPRRATLPRTGLIYTSRTHTCKRKFKRILAPRATVGDDKHMRLWPLQLCCRAARLLTRVAVVAFGLNSTCTPGLHSKLPCLNVCPDPVRQLHRRLSDQCDAVEFAPSGEARVNHTAAPSTPPRYSSPARSRPSPFRTQPLAAPHPTMGCRTQNGSGWAWTDMWICVVILCDGPGAGRQRVWNRWASGCRRRAGRGA